MARAGDSARKSGDYVCNACGEHVRVEQGQSIPECPGCGGADFAASEEAARTTERKG